MTTSLQNPVIGGSGAVATDVIWDAKGDLAAATGADAAARVAAGANGTSLIADSAQSAGVRWDTPIGTIVDYVEFATDVTVSATTEATANTVVTGAGFTPNGTDSFMIEFYCSGILVASNAGAQVIVVLYDNGSSISAGAATIQQLVNPAAATFIVPGFGKRRVTPTNAAHAYSIRAYRVTNNGTIRGTAAGTSLPGYIMVTKVS